MQSRPTQSNLEEKENFNDDEEICDTVETKCTPTTSGNKSRKRKAIEESSLDRELVKLIKKNEEIDTDTHFLLSLVPAMRELSDDEKIEAKLQILQIFKQERANRNTVCRRSHSATQHN